MRIAVVTLVVCAFALSTLTMLSGRTAFATTEAPEIVGESAIVINADSGAILYDINSGEQLAPASLTKIFTAYFAIDATPLQRRMTVVKDDLVGEASAGLNAGDTLSLETLLHGLLLASGNDAAMTVARNVGESHAPSSLDGVASFSSYVNTRLAGLGLTGTNLVNPHGLDEDGHYSTAHDVAAMTMLALKTEPDFLRVLSAPGYAGEDMTYVQRNQLLGNYSGALGGKTGITDEAGYCLMSIAHRDGRTLISVVLGSTADAWYSDSMALLDTGFSIPTTPELPVVHLVQDASTSALSVAATNADGLALRQSGANAVSVRTAGADAGGSWTVIRWPLGTLLGMAVVLVSVVQVRALVELQKLPRGKGMRPRRSRPGTQRQPAGQLLPAPRMDETQPFATSRGWEFPSHSWSPGIGD